MSPHEVTGEGHAKIALKCVYDLLLMFGLYTYLIGTWVTRDVNGKRIRIPGFDENLPLKEMHRLCLKGTKLFSQGPCDSHCDNELDYYEKWLSIYMN